MFGGGLGSMLFLLLPILLIFWMTRSQTKKQKELEESLRVGDRVVTRAGIIGKIVKMGDRTVDIELAAGVTVPFLKSAVEGKDATDAKKEADSKKESDKDKSDKDKSDKDKSDKDKKDSKKGATA